MYKSASILAILLTLPTGADAYDLMTSKGIGLGRTLVLSEPWATTQVNLPTDGLKKGTWHCESGYNRRFELADLDQLFLAGAVRVRSFTLAAGVSQFGKSDLYAEQLIKGSVGYHYRNLVFGPTFSAMQVKIGGGYGSLRAATLGAGISAAWSRVVAGLAADNLTRPSLIAGSLPAEPTWSLYSELTGRGSYTINVRATWEKGQDNQYGVGQTIRLSERGTLFWGVASNPMEYGAGIEIGVGSGTIAYVTSVHPVLGFSHTVSFSYGTREKRTTKKGDDF